jgi:hypothetical protein
MTAVERSLAALGASEKYHRVGSSKPANPPEVARAWVAQLRSDLESQLGRSVRWQDEGETVFAEQFSFDSWHALRAFAADQQWPANSFQFDSQSSKHPGLARVWAECRSPYLHVIRHNDNNGYYLPCEFHSPFELSMSDDPMDRIVIGSSLVLLREMNRLGTLLGITLDQGEPGWTEQLRDEDPLVLVKTGWVFMRHCARLSVKHKLPVIFDG